MVDGLTFFSRAVSLILLIIFPPAQPKKTYFFSVIILSGFTALVATTPALGSFAYLILVIFMMISGFCMSYNVILVLILNEEFDAAGRDASKMKLWQSLSGYG